MKKILLILTLILLAGCVQEKPIGGERDEHGCLGPAGYSWCPSEEKCMRMWEEYCEEYADQYKKISLEQAIEIAEGSECTEIGFLTENSMYNDNSKTWWIDLMIKEQRQGCNPACVISEDKTAEINWRCTGVIIPKITNFEKCIAAGNPAMESYPRQCRANDQTFIEDITPFEKRCESDDDCACGVHAKTNDCFLGNKDFVNIEKQCPDFCSGIAGHLEVKCVDNECTQISSLS